MAASTYDCRECGEWIEDEEYLIHQLSDEYYAYHVDCWGETDG